MIVLDIETTGLFPAPTDAAYDADSITAIGFIDSYSLAVYSATIDEFKVSRINAEKRMLQQFSNYFYDVMPDNSFLTYNGERFDIPFLATRALHHGMADFSKDLLNMPDVDLMRFCTLVFGRRTSKESACSAFGDIYVPRKTDGFWTARIYKNPKNLTLTHHLKMLQHNAIDTSATMQLYEAVKDFDDFIAWRMKEFKD